jgi:hypothetical protein
MESNIRLDGALPTHKFHSIHKKQDSKVLFPSPRSVVNPFPTSPAESRKSVRKKTAAGREPRRRLSFNLPAIF